MAESAGLMVKFNASPQLVEELKSVVEQNPGVMTLKSAGPADEPSHLKLGLAEVSTLIAMINGAITLGKFAYSVYQHLSKHEGERLTLQTPLRTVEVLSSDAVSEARILELLQNSLRM
jgi:thiamine phosphate synthase YjbQ (UPF0047 family)